MEDKKLKKQLSSRHITMLALGGAIGAGLFKGSGEAIGIAGPSVLIAFFDWWADFIYRDERSGKNRFKRWRHASRIIWFDTPLSRCSFC